MAIGAERYQVLKGVDYVVFADLAERDPMMNLDFAGESRTVQSAEIDAAYGASGSMGSQAALTCRIL